MTDEIDNAQAKEEIGLADAIRAARAPGPVIVATGRCLYCDDIVSDTMRWCSVPCRNAWTESAKGLRK